MLRGQQVHKSEQIHQSHIGLDTDLFYRNVMVTAQCLETSCIGANPKTQHLEISNERRHSLLLLGIFFELAKSHPCNQSDQMGE